jgi:hypothetical protein
VFVPDPPAIHIIPFQEIPDPSTVKIVVPNPIQLIPLFE